MVYDDHKQSQHYSTNTHCDAEKKLHIAVVKAVDFDYKEAVAANKSLIQYLSLNKGRVHRVNGIVLPNHIDKKTSYEIDGVDLELKLNTHKKHDAVGDNDSVLEVRLVTNDKVAFDTTLYDIQSIFHDAAQTQNEKARAKQARKEKRNRKR